MRSQRIANDYTRNHPFGCNGNSGRPTRKMAEMPDVTIDQAIELFQAGRFQEVESICRRILADQPNHPESLHLLGLILDQAGHVDTAVEYIRKAIEAAPHVPAYHLNLGILLLKLSRVDQAIDCCRQAIFLKPDYPAAYNSLGNACKEKGDFDQAIVSYQRAIALRPDYSLAHYHLGNVWRIKGECDRAIECYHRTVASAPTFAQAHNNLGNALKDKGRLDEAIACYQRALEINPNHSEAHNNLGVVWMDKGRLHEAMACYDRALALNPNDAAAADNRLYALHFLPDAGPEEIFHAHCQWDRQFAQPLYKPAASHENDRTADRPLRIGYVSADFRLHSVAFFLLPLLEATDRRRFHVTCYAADSRSDEITARMRRGVDDWRTLVGLDDEQAAAQIRRDRIDILVDLAGHTFGNRLLLFARRPAPVQATYLGYPDTTGMQAMDWRLTDARADPPGSEQFCTEQLMRLPRTAWCFSPLFADVPLHKPAHSGVVFGSFGIFRKINDRLLRWWAEILRHVPHSHLFIKNRAVADELVAQELRRKFQAMDVLPDRLILSPPQQSIEQHLAAYGQVDIALDTFPYHGATTTCEAMWMGVPVVTLAGRAHVSRVGVSLLGSVGLNELIARDEREYVRIAVDLARDARRLRELQATLRTRMQTSPLMNAASFARDVESAYRRMWRHSDLSPLSVERVAGCIK
jgi:predicted O-linked N-acetylglucosamine transferase (SPINDLY family)